MLQEFIFNGQGSGPIANMLLNNGFNVNLLRPYIGKGGHSYVDRQIPGGKPGEVESIRTNSSATLRKDEWKHLDDAILRVARPRLKIFGDIRGRGLVYNIPNGMGKTVLEYETETEAGSARQSMDGLAKGENDTVEYELRSIPLPLTHSEFKISARKLAASREGNSPLDTSLAEKAGRRVAEMVERQAIGTTPAFSFGAGATPLYGLTTLPERLTKTITSPLAGGWTGKTLLNELLDMKQLLRDNNFFGPFMVYVGSSWDKYMDDDFSTAKGDITLRERLKMVENIEDVRTADFLSGYQIVMVQMTSDVVRTVVGMDIVTLQWEGQGGLEFFFKVMAILLTQVRFDAQDQCGICHGNVA